jgi:hypothetical protein
MILETASWVEIIWTVAAVVGLIISIWMLRDTVLDYYHVIVHSATTPKIIIAMGNARSELIKVGVYLLFFVVGVAAMMQPESTTQATVISTILRSAFIVMILLMVIGSLWDRFDRRQVLQAYLREIDDDGEPDDQKVV